MPPLSKEQIELLARRKLSGIITPEEQILLDQWLDQKPGKKMIWNSNDTDEQALRERLLERIREDAGIQHYSKQTKSVSFLQRYERVAAALLILIAGSLCYFLIFKKEVAPAGIVDNNIRVQHIPPGHSGAILTLSNGTKIVLDSTGNGKIAVQGTRMLVKQNGQLVYEKAGNEENKENEIIYNTLTTPRGREFRIMLSDGSTVWLNAASSITYPAAFTGKERKVKITGEVYFEIAKDSQHPFIVSVGQAKVTVLGTHFDVIAYPDEKLVKTTLLEGAVMVAKGEQQVIIAPGQQADFSSSSDHIHVAIVDTTQAIAWVNGQLSLDNLGVEAIMRKVSRWYNVDVEFKGPVPKEHFWGLINRNVDLSNMLKVMRANGINASTIGNKVIVSPDH